MGYYYEGSIKKFWPDDTEDELYLAHGATLMEIMQKVEEKWPGVEFQKISVDAEYIHTDYCFTYGRYDPGDYIPFVVVRRTGE